MKRSVLDHFPGYEWQLCLYWKGKFCIISLSLKELDLRQLSLMFSHTNHPCPHVYRNTFTQFPETGKKQQKPLSNSKPQTTSLLCESSFSFCDDEISVWLHQYVSSSCLEVMYLFVWFYFDRNQAMSFWCGQATWRSTMRESTTCSIKKTSTWSFRKHR